MLLNWLANCTSEYREPVLGNTFLFNQVCRQALNLNPFSRYQETERADCQIASCINCPICMPLFKDRKMETLHATLTLSRLGPNPQWTRMIELERKHSAGCKDDVYMETILWKIKHKNLSRSEGERGRSTICFQ